MAQQSIHQYGVGELVLEASVEFKQPDLDCAVMAEFRGPAGRRLSLRSFWDGGRIWKVRFSLDEPGTWHWTTRCVKGADPALEEQGTVECVPYEGENALYRHGPLQLSEDRRRIVHRDGTPFFWLADTAWNGVIRGDDDNWKRFLETRACQRFTGVQFVANCWRGDAVDEAGEPSCEEPSPIRMNPRFFQRLDKRVAMVNEAGLVASPVALWSLLENDIGRRLAEEDAARLAEYIVARYDAYQVVWLFAGDLLLANDASIDRWRRLGRRVFEHTHGRLVTLHTCGENWSCERFRDEGWYHLATYQSGHGDSDNSLRWLTQGPPSTKWENEPVLPVLNLEPNYETARGYAHQTVFDDFHVRRGAYWSLLVSPTAGVTYGHDAIWNWNLETGPSEGHGDWHEGRVPPWHTGLETPGIESMTVLRGIFERLDWTTLMPALDSLSEQPGKADPKEFVVAAKTADGTLVIYAPTGGTVRLTKEVDSSIPCHCVDPRTGEAGPLKLAGDTIRFPDRRDWLAVIGQLK